MSRLERLADQPFGEASNRGFNLLLLCGVALLGVAALAGRHPLVESAAVAYLLSIPAYVAFRVRAWNEDLAAVDPPEGREEASAVGFDDEQGDGDDGTGGEADEGSD